MKKVSLAGYLFARLRQHGVCHVHGVPGDYTLRALDYLKCSRIKWIGSCNELNAGYAADGYARIRGLSAVFTTYGVGELSAINAIAGSYAEHVPVAHIVGTPARHLQASRAMCHHTLGDGRHRVFAEMSEKVTVAQANLVDAEQAPEMIDHTIQQCLVHSRPVYVEIPADMVSAAVSAERLCRPLTSTVEVDEVVEDTQVRTLLQRIYSSKQPLLLVDRGSGMHHITEDIEELVRISGIPTLSMPSGQGMIETTTPNYYGVHSGPVGYIDTMPYMQSSDLVLAFGPMFSDTQTLAWLTVPDPSITIIIRKNAINTATTSHPINAKSFMQKLLSKLDPSKLPHADTTSLRDFRHRHTPPQPDPHAQITQDGLYDRLNTYLRPHDILLLANGTPLLGARDLLLPPHTTVIASGLWFSMGHMLPAAQGAALAQQGPKATSRTVLFEGDGSFQVSAQELSTIIKLKLDVTVFIVNNAGYAYERLIRGLHADYNDVASWRYSEAIGFFGAPRDSRAPDGYAFSGHRVTTWGELDDLLRNRDWVDAKGLKIVDVVVGMEDVPGKFRGVFERAGKQL
jgi:pyruvate decarboxylase